MTFGLMPIDFTDDSWKFRCEPWSSNVAVVFAMKRPLNVDSQRGGGYQKTKSPSGVPARVAQFTHAWI